MIARKIHALTWSKWKCDLQNSQGGQEKTPTLSYEALRQLRNAVYSQLCCLRQFQMTQEKSLPVVACENNLGVSVLTLLKILPIIHRQFCFNQYFYLYQFNHFPHHFFSIFLNYASVKPFLMKSHNMYLLYTIILFALHLKNFSKNNK